MGRFRTCCRSMLVASILFSLWVIPRALSAGELKIRIPIFTGYVGQEMVVPLEIENTNQSFSISNITGRLSLEKGINPVKVLEDLGPWDLEPGEKKTLEIETGWTPDQAGWMEARIWLQGDDNINGEQYFVQSVQVKDAPPCPERPILSSGTIYLGGGSSGSVTYSAAPSTCCYQIRVTGTYGKSAIQSWGPQSWTAVGSSASVDVTVDPAKMASSSTVMLKVAWKSCDDKYSGIDYILVNSGTQGQEGASTSQPPGSTGGQTPSSGTDGDPVKTATLEQVTPIATVDIEHLAASPIQLNRTFLSKLPAVQDGGDFGPGWTHEHDWSMAMSGKQAVVFGPAGYRARFIEVAGSWSLDWPKSDQVSLTELDENTVAYGDGAHLRTIHFDRDGQIRSVHYGTGIVHTYEYEGGLLAAITAPSGRGLAFERNADGLIIRASNALHEVQYSYTDGLLTGFADDAGHRWTYQYQSGTPYLSRIVSPEGRSSMTVEYNASGEVVSQDLGEGQVFTFGRGKGPNATVIQGPGDVNRIHTHNGKHQLTELTGPDGTKATFTYDANGNRTRLVDLMGGTTTRTYDDGLFSKSTWANDGGLSVQWEGRLIGDVYVPFVTRNAYTDGPTVDVTVSENEDTRITTVENGSGLRTEITENMADLILSAAGPTGSQTYHRNADGRVDSIVHGDGKVERFRYDEVGRLVFHHDYDGREHRYTYDSRNHVLTFGVSGSEFGVQYDRDGYTKEVTDPEGRMTRYAYDSRGRVTSETKVGSPSLMHSYQWTGTRLTGEDGFDFTYDGYDRLTGIMDPDGRLTKFLHNAEGGVTRIEGPGEKRAIDFGLDPIGFMTSKAPAGLGITVYDRNNYGGLIGLKTSSGVQYNIERDVNGDVTGIEAPLGLRIDLMREFRGTGDATTTVKDGNGQTWRHVVEGGGMHTYTSPLGMQVFESYDALGRLVKIDWDGNSAAEFTYSGSRLTEAKVDGKVEFTAQYDLSGLLSKINTTEIGRDDVGRPVEAGGIRHTYDDNGRLSSVSRDGAYQVQYTYTEGGLLESVTDWMGEVVTYTYDDAGNLIKESYKSGYEVTYEYTDSGLLLGIEDNTGWWLDLYRDATGRVIYSERADDLDMDAPVLNLNLRYTADNRIEGADYDTRGNLTGLNDLGLRLRFSYGGLSGIGDEDNVERDDFGYVSRIRDQAGDKAFRWDPLRGIPALLSIMEGLSVEWHYVTDNEGNILYGYDQNGRKNIFVSDLNGNVLIETNGSGDYEDANWYDPYGNSINAREPGGLRLGFMGGFGAVSLGNGLDLRDGGKTVTAPAVGRDLDAKSTMPGFPSNTDPRTENGQTNTDMVDVTPYLQAFLKSVGGDAPSDKAPAAPPEPPAIETKPQPAVSLGDDGGPLPGLEDLYEEQQQRAAARKLAEAEERARSKRERERQIREDEEDAKRNRILKDGRDINDFTDPSSLKTLPNDKRLRIFYEITKTFGLFEDLYWLFVGLDVTGTGGAGADGGEPKTTTPTSK